MPLDRSHQHISSDIVRADAIHTPIDPDGGGATPTLAEVAPPLTWDGTTLAQTAGAQGYGAQLSLGPDPGTGDGGGVLLYGAGGAAGHGGGAVILQGGDGDEGGLNAIGGKVYCAPGAGDGTGGDIYFTAGPGSGGAPDGLIYLNLPTSDPAVAGALWSDAGAVKVSAG